MTPLAMYVHLPWCVRKCPYCDFNSWQGGDAKQRADYLDALAEDIRFEATRADGRLLDSIFIGGGTPSLFTPAEIAELIDTIRAVLPIAANAEITMEANPGTMECGAPQGYRAAGINRLSIGAQSFDADALQRLGRIHSVDDIASSFHDARNAGFDNINVDVMHALPGQSVDAAVDDLRKAIALDPEHLSWYQLTLEPNTVFHARPPDGLPDEDAAWQIQEAGFAVLERAGFKQYEVSAWARPGRESRHNLNYWRFGDYLAVGAGAHGKLSHDGGIRRYRKPANPRAYVAAARAGFDASADPIADPTFEFMLNALRLVDGFDEAVFEARTGVSRDTLARRAESAVRKKLIMRENDGFWRPTDLGRRFLNDLQAEFLA